MKLSERTIKILKNFTQLNPGIVLQPGKNQRTCDEQKSSFAMVELDEDFPLDFAIYDLGTFLSCVSEFKDVNVEFDEDAATISSGGFKVVYRAAAPDLVVSIPKDKNIKITEPITEFVLKKDDFNKILSLCALTNLKDVVISGSDEVLSIRGVDPKDETSNQMEFTLPEKFEGEDFNASFKLDLMRFIPDAYTVSIHERTGKFVSSDGRLSYVIARSKAKD